MSAERKLPYEILPPDEPTVRQFMQSYHDAAAESTAPYKDPGVLQLVAILPIGEKSTIITTSFAIGDFEAMAELALTQAANGFNVYVEPRTVIAGLSKKKRGTAEATRAVFFLNLDNDSESSKPGRLPVEPSLRIETSPPNNTHELLHVVPGISQGEATAIGKAMRKIAGGDACTGNPTQPFRVPGTPNYPNEAKRARGRVSCRTSIMGGSDKTYSLEELRAAFPVVAAAAAAPVTGDVDLTLLMQKRLPADLNILIREGVAEGNRSDQFHHCIGWLRDCGWGPEAITELLSQYPDGIAAKYNGRLAEEVSRCYGKVESKPAPAKPTLRLVHNEPLWPDISEKTGKPLKTYSNARVAIEALGITCTYDVFHDCKEIGGHAIGEHAGQLTDAACAVLRDIIIDTYGLDPGKENVHEAALALCIQNSFDPVIDYLNGLKWDGVERLEKWTITYLGAEDTELNRAIGWLVLVAAVRRARQPGCKFDHVLVLEGPEATLKSTTIAVLAGEENFSDQTILSAGDKEVQELVAGVWFYEVAELAGMRRAEIEKVKALISRTHDRARGAYRRHRTDAARRCIFIATTNEDSYLKSQTGNRRFLPLKVGCIDITALRRDRDQLFAEACAAEALGGPLTLPETLWTAAREAQAGRLEQDPWDDVLVNNLSGYRYPAEGGQLQEWIKATDVLTALNISAERATPDTHKRLKRVMERLGWTAGRPPLRWAQSAAGLLAPQRTRLRDGRDV